MAKSKRFNKMKPKKEFIEKVLGLISKSAILMGKKPDAQTLAVLSTHFAKVLLNNKRLKTLSWNQVEAAFEEGILKDNQFLSIPTFYKWCTDMKQKINNAYYEVHTLNKPKEQVPYYQSQKLLK
jgi:hypothetical protein|tara:strand:- start:1902 stop:2273 length:372 start_codon:yes stop_codon:yes gene_type:complete